MSKYIKVATQTNMLKLKDDTQENWVSCTPEVKSYAAQNLVEGTDVDVSYEQKGNVKTIVKIGKLGELKVGQPAPAVQAQNTPGTTGAAIIASGATIGISSEAQKSAGTVTKILSEPNKYRDPMTPAESRSVRRQAVMGYACNAVTAVQTQIDEKVLGDYIIALFQKLLVEVEK